MATQLARFRSLALSVSQMTAQLDIDSNHWPVHVNAIVPNTPTGLSVAFGQVQLRNMHEI
jgi:hypothetical protein